MAIPSLDELGLLHENICQAVGDPKRIQLLYALHEQSRSVNALAEALDLPQPTVSRHLAILRQRGMVIAEREGNSAIYRLVDSRIIEVLDTMRLLLRDAMERRADMLTGHVP
jgi:DNA-binding transcriptional ArsR family regulator